MMITPRTRPLVSLATALTVAGCASTASRPVSGGPAPSDEPPVAIRFDNGGQSDVQVYLVGEKREWWLGHVQIGARATLRIPEDALAEAGPVRLAVVEGQRRPLQVASDSRAATTIRQPIAAIVSQRWMFTPASSVQLTSLPRDPRRR